MLVGIITVFFLASRKAKKNNFNIYDLFIVGGFALLLALPFGGVLYTIVTYDLHTIIQNILSFNFEIFGGIVFYGALIGGILGSLIGAYVANAKICEIEKVIIPYIPIGHAIGRVGCVLAGCCYGAEYSGPFAVYYSHSVAGAKVRQGYFPTQLLEAILNIGISYLLIKVSKKRFRTFELLSLYFLLYGALRFFIEFLRGDAIRGIYFSLSTSQWISLCLILVSVGYLCINKMTHWKRQTPHGQ